MNNSLNVVAHPLPLGLGVPYLQRMPVGRTVQQIIDAIPKNKLPIKENLKAVLSGPKGDTIIDRKLWSFVRPKAGLTLSFQVAPTGGDDSGNAKKVIAVVIAIAIIATGHFELLEIPVFLLEAATTVLVSSALSLAVSALTRPPAAQARGEEAVSDNALGTSSAQGNVLNPGGPIPVILGRRKVFPPMACQPLVELQGKDEIVEITYVLDGPHSFENIRIDDVAIEDVEGIEFEVKEGFDDDLNIILYQRYGFTDQAQKRLSNHRTDESDTEILESQTEPNTSLPHFEHFISEKNPDEIWMSVLFGGFVFGDNPTILAAVPMRIRMRPKGTSTWINLPEIHFVGKAIQDYRKQIKLIWASSGSSPVPPSSNGVYVAYQDVPGQITLPATTGWEADSHFDDLSGDIDGVQNVSMYPDRVEFYLDESSFPRGEKYEVEVIKGVMYKKTSLTQSTYSYSGSVKDFFTYRLVTGSATIAEDQDSVANDATIQRLASIYNDKMIQEKGFASLSIRGKNIDVQNVSIDAASYIPDWNGTEWLGWVASNNPASHYRNVLVGNLAHPTKRENVLQLDNDNLVEWRQACIDNSWEISTIIQGRTAAEVREMIASTAYARPKGPLWGWGVAIDVDRSADLPVQFFTPRNSANLRWKKSFAEVADGFRITFDDEDNDYQTREIIVMHPNIPIGRERTLEALTYDTITNETMVRDRALHDLKTLRKRNVKYLFDVPLDGLVCERGSLVILSNDLITRNSQSARISEIFLNGSSEVIAIRADTDLNFVNEAEFWDNTDFWEVDDIWNMGIQTAAEIRYPLDSVSVSGNDRIGVQTVTLSNPTGLGSYLQFGAPFAKPEGLEVGALFSIGPVENVEGRFIVLDTKRSRDLTATLTLIEEAPSLFA